MIPFENENQNLLLRLNLGKQKPDHQKLKSSNLKIDIKVEDKKAVLPSFFSGIRYPLSDSQQISFKNLGKNSFYLKQFL